MAGIQALNPDDTSLDTLRDAWSFARSRIAGDPNAAPYLTTFNAFGAQWDTVKQKENALRDGVMGAAAAAVIVDHTLNSLLERVSAAIHRGRRVDTDLPQHRLYFGNDAPSLVKRPTLGAQLERMRSWPALLGQEADPELNGLTAEATAAVAAGNQAEATIEQAQVNASKFRLGGERSQLFDTFNSICATTFGGLKAFAHAHPELRLPPDYAESFFWHAKRGQRSKTVQEAADRMRKLEEELEKARRVHAGLVAEEQAAAEEKQTQAHAKAAVAEAKKAVKDVRTEAKKKLEEAKSKAKAAKAAAKKRS